MKFFAHRGYSHRYPENTMPAFEKAIEAKVDGIELDVQLSKEGEAVIIHDEELRPLTDGRGFVRDHSLEELRRLTVLSEGFEDSPQKIPTLEEYCARVRRESLVTNIELKTGIFPYPGIEERVLGILRKYKLEDRVIISSFNHYSVLRFKALAPFVRCGLLTKDWIVNLGAYAASVGVECVHPFYLTLTKETVKEIKSHNLEINTWTVNRREDYISLLELGVDRIIGDDPEIREGL